jgi:hypothetical protein
VGDEAGLLVPAQALRVDPHLDRAAALGDGSAERGGLAQDEGVARAEERPLREAPPRPARTPSRPWSDESATVPPGASSMRR